MELIEFKHLTQEQLIDVIKKAKLFLTEENLRKVDSPSQNGWWDCSK